MKIAVAPTTIFEESLDFHAVKNHLWTPKSQFSPASAAEKYSLHPMMRILQAIKGPVRTIHLLFFGVSNQPKKRVLRQDFAGSKYQIISNSREQSGWPGRFPLVRKI